MEWFFVVVAIMKTCLQCVVRTKYISYVQKQKGSKTLGCPIRNNFTHYMFLGDALLNFTNVLTFN